MPVIVCKAQMQPRLRSGEFGNTHQTWDTLNETLESGHPGPLVIRYKGSGTNHFWTPNIAKNDLLGKVQESITFGARLDQMYFGEYLDVSKVILHGSVARSERYVELEYSFVKKPLREAMNEDGRHAEGVAAVYLLHKYLNVSEYEHIFDLLETYDDIIIEPRPVVDFTLFERPCGTENQYLIIWEVTSDWSSYCQLPWPAF